MLFLKSKVLGLRAFWMVILGGALVSCTMVDPHVGSGPIELQGSAKVKFARYLEEANPTMFVVTTSGRNATYLYCPAATFCSKGGRNVEAIARCEKRFAEECKIYALGRAVVWNFDQPGTQTE